LRIRIVLAALPRMLADIVESVVAAQPDMVLSSRVAGGAGLAGTLREEKPQVLIVGLSADEDAAHYDDLLFEHPRMKVLAITSTGRESILSELRPVRHAIGNVSPEGLMDAIRHATQVPVA
jgi:hypothetical protein